MNYTLKCLALFSITILMFGCSDSDDKLVINDPVCDNSSTQFQQMFNGLLATSTTHDMEFMDLEVHEYSFMVSSPKNICSIGYQSAHSDPTVPYTIEIVNNSNNTILYSGSHVFSQSATSYVTLNSAVALLPNVSYTIKRIQTNVNGDAANITGRMANSYDNSSSISILPVTQGDLTITSSNFHDVVFTNSMPVTFMLPYIDIVFEN